MRADQDIIPRVRLLLSDDAASPRWTDSNLMVYVADGRELFWSLRPAAFFTDAAGIITSLPSFDSAVGSEIGLRNDCREAMVLYVAAKAIGEDAEHAANQKLSAGWMAEALAKL